MKQYKKVLTDDGDEVDVYLTVFEDGRSRSIPHPREGEEPHRFYEEMMAEVAAGTAEIVEADG